MSSVVVVREVIYIPIFFPIMEQLLFNNVRCRRRSLSNVMTLKHDSSFCWRLPCLSSLFCDLKQLEEISNPLSSPALCVCTMYVLGTTPMYTEKSALKIEFVLFSQQKLGFKEKPVGPFNDQFLDSFLKSFCFIDCPSVMKFIGQWHRSDTCKPIFTWSHHGPPFPLPFKGGII